MAWNPITRNPGGLGIYATVDLGRGRVLDCHAASTVFGDLTHFMAGKDPRDAPLISTRLCEVCGDSHRRASTAALNMAAGVVPSPLSFWMANLSQAAEYLADHCVVQENLVGVDFCEKVVAETNPGVLDRADRTEAPNAARHGDATVGAIMRSLNPFSGELSREALAVGRWTREMMRLIDDCPAGTGTGAGASAGADADETTAATIRRLTEYRARLLRYAELMKRLVPLHDDLFLFFYDALPGYEEVGRRRMLTACWGSFPDPAGCDFDYRTMAEWGRAMFVTPGVVVDGQLVSDDLVEINLGMRILLGHSFRDDWEDEEPYVTEDPLGNPVDRRHPWNARAIPRPQKQDFDGNYSWGFAPRWFDGKDHLALDTGGGPLARLLAVALAGRVDVGYAKATGRGIEFQLPRTALAPAQDFAWEVPKWSNAIERNRARSYFQLYACCAALHFVDRALAEVRADRADPVVRASGAGAGHPQTSSEPTVPEEAIGCGLADAARGALSHHLVVRGERIANYHSSGPTAWNASPRDAYGTPGPLEEAVANTPIFEESSRAGFKGVDILRAVRSFDPCLRWGVHVSLAEGGDR